MLYQGTLSCALAEEGFRMQGGENEEDMPLPGSLPAELPNGRVPKLESSKGWGRLALPGKSKPKPLKPTVVRICLC